jgi:hypothetical protein
MGVTGQRNRAMAMAPHTNAQIQGCHRGVATGDARNAPLSLGSTSKRAAIMSPSLFADAPSGEFSLTKMFDRANEQERLFGLRLDGVWMHVGTPDAVHAAE